MSDPRPCSPSEAVQRALRWVDKPGVYWLGAGDYRPVTVNGVTVDAPWTNDPDGKPASDCRFAIGYCYKLPAHRPGFNVGPWASVADDVNYNSAIEDSEHARDLFVPVTDAPQVGDILTYPTIRLRDASGRMLEFIGHGSIVINVTRAAAFDINAPNFSLLDIVHCHGPAGRGPTITMSNGALFDVHSERWPKAQHCSRLLRLAA